MNFFDAIILGIVEGITEFLPISSTGHLILTSQVLGLAPTDFLKTFQIVIQFGAILGVVFLYWKILLRNFRVFKLVLTAFIPSVILGLIFYRIIKNYLLDNLTVVLVALFLGGVFLIVFEKFHKEKDDALETLGSISYRQALLIGLAQCAALVPGVSRSAATVLGGLALNLKRKTIVEFSFLLAVPTMLAASVLDLYQNAGLFSADQFGLLSVGFIISFFVAIASVKFLLKFIQKNTFTAFGVYRVILALLFWLFVF